MPYFSLGPIVWGPVVFSLCRHFDMSDFNPYQAASIQSGDHLAWMIC